MKKLWPLLALGIGAFLLLALVTLPAKRRAVVRSIRPASRSPASRARSGTAARKQCAAAPLHVGSVEWDLDVLSSVHRQAGRRRESHAHATALRRDPLLLHRAVESRCADSTHRCRSARCRRIVVRGGWTGTLNLKLGAIGARELLAGCSDGHGRSHGSGRPGESARGARQLQSRLSRRRRRRRPTR